MIMNVKNSIVLGSIVLLLGLSVFFLFHKIQENNSKKEGYHTIPVFRLPDINGNPVTESVLQKKVSTLFMSFNPDCDLCVEEIKQIQLNQDAFSFYQMVFFSALPVEKISSFLSQIQFEPSENMFFLVDENGKLTNKMEVKTSPTVYIYNRKGVLIKRFDGPVKIETLIKYLSE